MEHNFTSGLKCEGVFGLLVDQMRTTRASEGNGGSSGGDAPLPDRRAASLFAVACCKLALHRFGLHWPWPLVQTGCHQLSRSIVP
jgi:hypothetical protein